MPYANPDQAREYQREYRRIRRAGDCCTTPRTATLPGEFRLKTAEDVLAMLGVQVEAVRADENTSSLDKARCIGYLAAVSLKAIEAGNVAARLDAIEAALTEQQGAATALRLAECRLLELSMGDEAALEALAALHEEIEGGEDDLD